VRRIAALAALAVVVTGGSLAAQPAGAAFPGANGRIVFVSEQPGTPVITSMELDGSDVEFLTLFEQTPYGDQNPRWSPGGTQVVFSRYEADGDGDIWIMKADGSGQKRLTTNATDDDWAGFSADGSRIVFTSDRHGNYEIYSMNLNGGDVKRLTNSPGFDWLPAWSPNNDRIAFSSDRRTGYDEIWTMKPDGSGLARETTTAETFDLDPEWAADGLSIAFTRWDSELEQSESHRVVVATNATSVLLEQNPDIAQFDVALPPSPSTTEYLALFVQYFQEASILATDGIDYFTINPAGHSSNSYMPDWQPVPAFPLVDARFSTFKLDIEWVFAEGITFGCSAERYCPNDPVTREQMASFLVRALDLSGTPPDAFTDDETSSHEHNINLLAAAGITSGCGPGLYCPKAVVKRDQMASFLARALDLPATATDYFTDDEVNTHEANINRLRAAGITTGCTATTYCPTADVTRGQMAAFLHRAFDD
jgi:hypothetical protein